VISGVSQLNMEKKKNCEILFSNAQKDESIDNYTEYIVAACEQLKTYNSKEEIKLLNERLGLAFNNRGLAKYKHVDFEDAIKDYSSALIYKPKWPVALYNRGLIHYRLGRFKNAAVDLETAFAIDPNFADVKKCLEHCYNSINEGKC
ncbi:unnamed protein product, partial [Owenia fusiformis]